MVRHENKPSFKSFLTLSNTGTVFLPICRGSYSSWSNNFSNSAAKPHLKGPHENEQLHGSTYKEYYNLAIDGGGWTLVFTIHENRIGDGDTVRCTVGDKSSSYQENDSQHPQGDASLWSCIIINFPGLQKSCLL